MAATVPTPLMFIIICSSYQVYLVFLRVELMNEYCQLHVLQDYYKMKTSLL